MSQEGEPLDATKLKAALKKQMNRNKKLQEQCKDLYENQNILRETLEQRDILIKNMAIDHELKMNELKTETEDRIKAKDEQLNQLNNMLSEKQKECTEVTNLHDQLVATFNEERMKLKKESEELLSRVAKLENYLLGRTWEFSPINTRIDRLKLASQRKMLSGTSLPVGIRRYVSPQRIANDSTPIYENDDNVGIIDGLLKLYMPSI